MSSSSSTTSTDLLSMASSSPAAASGIGTGRAPDAFLRISPIAGQRLVRLDILTPSVNARLAFVRIPSRRRRAAEPLPAVSSNAWKYPPRLGHHPHRVRIQTVSLIRGVRLDPAGFQASRAAPRPSGCGRSCRCKGRESSAYASFPKVGLLSVAAKLPQAVAYCRRSGRGCQAGARTMTMTWSDSCLALPRGSRRSSTGPGKASGRGRVCRRRRSGRRCGNNPKKRRPHLRRAAEPSVPPDQDAWEGATAVGKPAIPLPVHGIRGRIQSPALASAVGRCDNEPAQLPIAGSASDGSDGAAESSRCPKVPDTRRFQP